MKKYDGKLIEFKTKDNILLHGFLEERKKNNKKIIIHLHRMCGNFYRSNIVKAMSKFLPKKYDIFAINTRGAGVITKFYNGNKKRIIGTALEKFEKCLIDIDEAIKIISKLGYEEIVLCGHSTGCQKVTYYQGKKQNKKIKAIVLLAPADDYNVAVHEKEIYKKAVKNAKKMVQEKRGNEIMKKYSPYSAKRYLSFADPKNVEAQLFNYDGEMKYFSKIKIPILVIFGSREEHKVKSTKKMLEILKEKTTSEFLETVEIKEAKHSFVNKEKELTQFLGQFLESF